ncbi:hypothetical protein ACN27G_29410 [Plantactinospora sp. WMMB334]|uniref:hypothetical protein n=1 Tax=Plantactinospora sp. WMMB334 TaxID=3404119 RepID=UPI003B92965E
MPRTRRRLRMNQRTGWMNCDSQPGDTQTRVAARQRPPALSLLGRDSAGTFFCRTDGRTTVKPFVTGQRVAPVIDGDIASAFGHGPQGTVGNYDPDQQILAVTWDDGTQQTLPAETRLIRLTTNWTPSARTGLSWQQTLDAVRSAGERAGQDGADWWCRHHIGASATGNPNAAARSALLDFAEDCPEMIDRLPMSAVRDESFTEPPTETDLLTLRHGVPVPSGETVSDQQRDQAHDAYLEAFDTRLARVRRRAVPAGDQPGRQRPRPSRRFRTPRRPNGKHPT